MGIGTIVTVASLIILGTITFFVPVVRDFLNQVLDFMKRGFEWFQNTAPAPIKILVFVFLILFLGNFIISFFTVGYACVDDNLREIDGGFFGGIAFVFGSLTIDDADTTVCSGSVANSCGNITDVGQCQSVGCIYITSCFGVPSSCSSYTGDNSTCSFMGCSSVFTGNTTSLDTYTIDRSSPSVTYSGDTPENLLTLACISDTPRWTIRGWDFLAYRNLLILLLLGGLIWLIVKFNAFHS